MGIRQEVLNVLMAELLQKRGLVAAPEQILTNAAKSRRIPDVLVDFRGLRLAIEGEFDGPKAKGKASASALHRVEEGLAHIGVALIYPAPLRNHGGSIDDLRSDLEKATLRFAVVTEAEAVGPEQLAFPFDVTREQKYVAFVQGDVDSLADALPRAYEQLVKDAVLDRAVTLLQGTIEAFSYALRPQQATTHRFAAALGIRALPKTAHTKEA